MSGFQDKVALGFYNIFEFSGVVAPEEENQPSPSAQFAQYAGSECFPAFAGVGIGLPFPDGQDRIQNQDPLGQFLNSSFGISRSYSIESSRRIFRNEGGSRTPSGTLKAKPSAWPSSW